MTTTGTEKAATMEEVRGAVRHWHLFAFHKHPLWHGHCFRDPFEMRCHYRCEHSWRCQSASGHRGKHKSHHDCPDYFAPLHSCRRRHWHFWWRHAHD